MVEIRKRNGHSIEDEEEEEPTQVSALNLGAQEPAQDRIKFVSMIDSKPIQPNYLDLIPMKNFTKKE